MRDAAAIGAPDARFGERVCAVLELQPDAREPSLGEIAAHVKEHLADYKAPRALVVLSSLNRAPNGKLDYKDVKARALEALAR